MMQSTHQKTGHVPGRQRHLESMPQGRAASSCTRILVTLDPVVKVYRSAVHELERTGMTHIPSGK